jgi:hypothetical protein
MYGTFWSKNFVAFVYVCVYYLFVRMLVWTYKAGAPPVERSSKKQATIRLTYVSKSPPRVSNRFYYLRSILIRTGQNVNGKFRLVVFRPSAQLGGFLLYYLWFRVAWQGEQAWLVLLHFNKACHPRWHWGEHTERNGSCLMVCVYACLCVAMYACKYIHT